MCRLVTELRTHLHNLNKEDSSMVSRAADRIEELELQVQGLEDEVRHWAEDSYHE